MLNAMAAATPPVVPNARTALTLLRGCLRVGHVQSAASRRLRSIWAERTVGETDGYCGPDSLAIFGLRTIQIGQVCFSMFT